jgi:Domain of unknown function (DUF305)
MRSPPRSYRLTCSLLLATGLGGVTVARAGDPGTSSNEATFWTENKAAMDRMMSGMEVKPSGDVDQDFSAMMIPHHQGAIDMAIAELRYGHNEQLRRIAQEIVVEQQQEIAAMRLALGQSLPPSVPAQTQSEDMSSTSHVTGSSPKKTDH